MVDHLKVSENEAILSFLEYVCANAAEIKRRYPDLIGLNDCVDEATLNVAD